MGRRTDEQMVHITGCDDFGWSWQRVDAEGQTVAEGKSGLAEDALRSASETARQPRIQPGQQDLKP